MLNPGREKPTNCFPLSDNRIGQRSQSYNTVEGTNSGVWSSKIGPKNYMDCHNGNDVGVQFGTESKVEDESGICSPPLWTRSQPRSPQHLRNQYRSLSPSSKTQAIERGQRELMEMVRNMPELCYELSLKDLVDPPRVDDIREEHRVGVGEKNLSNKILHKRVVGQSGNGRKVDNKGQVKTSGKIDSGGLYLKMVFPTTTSSLLGLGSKKKNNKKKNETNNCSKVSPRPSVSDGSMKQGLDNEWWNKSGRESNSNSGVSSVTSGRMKSYDSSTTTNSITNNRHKISAGSCWHFFRRSESLAQN